MGVLGEMFPGRRITDEADEDGDAQPWRLTSIDLDRGVVQVRRAVLPVEEDSANAEQTDAGAGSSERD